MSESYLKKITKIKQETNLIEDILRTYHYINPDFVHYANKMRECCQHLVIQPNSDGLYRYVPAWSCGVPFCPLCFQKNKPKHEATFYSAHDCLMQRQETKSCRFIELILTIEACQAKNIKQVVKNLAEGFARLINLKQVRDVVVSASKFLHYGITANDGWLQPHYHVILLVKAPGRRSLSVYEWQQLWKEAMRLGYDPKLYLQALGKTNHDFVNKLLYGLEAVHPKDIQGNAYSFAQLLNHSKNIQKYRHYLLMKEVISNIKRDYQGTVNDDRGNLSLRYDAAKRLYLPVK